MGAAASCWALSLAGSTPHPVGACRSPSHARSPSKSSPPLSHTARVPHEPHTPHSCTTRSLAASVCCMTHHTYSRSSPPPLDTTPGATAGPTIRCDPRYNRRPHQQVQPQMQPQPPPSGATPDATAAPTIRCNRRPHHQVQPQMRPQPPPLNATPVPLAQEERNIPRAPRQGATPAPPLHRRQAQLRRAPPLHRRQAAEVSRPQEKCLAPFLGTPKVGQQSKGTKAPAPPLHTHTHTCTHMHTCTHAPRARRPPTPAGTCCPAPCTRRTGRAPCARTACAQAAACRT